MAIQLITQMQHAASQLAQFGRTSSEALKVVAAASLRFMADKPAPTVGIFLLSVGATLSGKRTWDWFTKGKVAEDANSARHCIERVAAKLDDGIMVSVEGQPFPYQLRTDQLVKAQRVLEIFAELRPQAATANPPATPTGANPVTEGDANSSATPANQIASAQTLPRLQETRSWTGVQKQVQPLLAKLHELEQRATRKNNEHTQLLRETQLAVKDELTSLWNRLDRYRREGIASHLTQQAGETAEVFAARRQTYVTRVNHAISQLQDEIVGWIGPLDQQIGQGQQLQGEIFANAAGQAWPQGADVQQVVGRIRERLARIDSVRIQDAVVDGAEGAPVATAIAAAVAANTAYLEARQALRDSYIELGRAVHATAPSVADANLWPQGPSRNALLIAHHGSKALEHGPTPGFNLGRENSALRQWVQQNDLTQRQPQLRNEQAQAAVDRLQEIVEAANVAANIDKPAGAPEITMQFDRTAFDAALAAVGPARAAYSGAEGRFGPARQAFNQELARLQPVLRAAGIEYTADTSDALTLGRSLQNLKQAVADAQASLSEEDQVLFSLQENVIQYHPQPPGATEGFVEKLEKAHHNAGCLDNHRLMGKRVGTDQQGRYVRYPIRQSNNSYQADPGENGCDKDCTILQEIRQMCDQLNTQLHTIQDAAQGTFDNLNRGGLHCQAWWTPFVIGALALGGLYGLHHLAATYGWQNSIRGFNV